MARGFGSTSGAGTTDSITSGYTTGLTGQKRSYSIWSYSDGTNSGAAPARMFEKRTAGAQVELLYQNATPAYEYNVNWGGAGQPWTFSLPASLKWHHIAITYDSALTTNNPSIYVDGVLQTLGNPSPSGSVTTNADAYVVGNRTNDSARGWGGYIADFAIWDGLLLTVPEILSLWVCSVRPKQIRPNSLVCYLPLASNQIPWLDKGRGGLIGSVTGTKARQDPSQLYRRSPDGPPMLFIAKPSLSLQVLMPQPLL